MSGGTVVPRPDVKVAVVIPTFNRVDFLMKALDSLAEQTFPSDQFEVIVVDNASTDATHERVMDFADRHPNVKYVFEGTPGLNVARNAGWRASHALYIAFLDDDAIPVPEWVERIVLAFEQPEPRPACVGGRIEPMFEVPAPKWITGLLLDYLTVINHSDRPFFLTDIIHRQKLAGANMAATREGLERVGGFLPGLDRVGSNLLSGGDVLLQLQFETLGLPVYYDPAIAVKHAVPAGRLTQSWLERRAYWGGVSDALLAFENGDASPMRAFRTAFWGLRAAMKAPLVIGTLALRAPAPEAVHARCDGWHRLGFVVGGCWAIRYSIERKRRR